MYNKLNFVEINLKNQEEEQEVNEFLQKFNLILDKDVDYTIVLRDRDEIKATASKAKNIFKCFAVSEEVRGEGITSELISKLIDRAFQEGIYHFFIFTKIENAQTFSNSNFKIICKTGKIALLENGIYDINTCIDNLMKKYNIDTTYAKSALVMNCNPFTKGHEYLIKKASKESKEVLVFIVEENKSIFPFGIRYKLVKEGVKDLKNVKIINGTEYIISSATFPSYFLKEEDERLELYTELDAKIFCEYFCNKMNIKKRYVGEEPLCNITHKYNDTLKNVLNKYSIDLIVIPRKREKEEIISATYVRKYIKNNDVDKIKDIVPEVTWDFLNSSKGKKIINAIRRGG